MFHLVEWSVLSSHYTVSVEYMLNLGNGDDGLDRARLLEIGHCSGELRRSNLLLVDLEKFTFQVKVGDALAGET